MSRTNSALIISHYDCWDGAMAAAIAEDYLLDNGYLTTTKYYKYGETPPSVDDVKGRDVYILDFSFSRDVLIELHAAAKSLIVLDHHKTAQADLQGLDFCQFDMERSGATMTWDYFYPNNSRPMLVRRVEDRDLWKWKVPNNKEFFAGLMLKENKVSTVQTLYDQSPAIYDESDSLLVEQGNSFLELLDAQAQYVLSKSFYLNISGHQVLFGASIPKYASELGNVLAENSISGRSCVFSFGTEVVSMSFRSVGDNDVSELAKMFGGGGHKNAAGGACSHEKFVEMMKGAERLIP